MPVIIPSTSATVGDSLLTMRWMLAARIGPFEHGSVTDIASGLEGARYAVSALLRTDFGSAARFDGQYLYPYSLGQAGNQRACVTGGFDGPNGAVMLDYPFDAVLQVGTGFEISALPAVDYAGATGLNTCLNLGLLTLPASHKVQVTSTGSKRIAMTGYPWPVRGVRQVFDNVSASDDRLIPTRQRWDFVDDAEGPYLQLSCAYASGTVFTVELLRPATTRIRQGTTWGDSTTGLVNDSDRCLYDATTVVNAAHPIALERLAQRFPRGSKERSDILGDAQDARVAASLSKFYGSRRGNGAQRASASGGR